MSTAKDKGNSLELAVQRIEESLLAHDPSLRGTRARIERNKKLIVDTVPYEIDVLVTVNVETPYETIHIFECKNWAQPVGAEEILKFDGKRREVRAHSATMVARAFTGPAEALAKKTGISLLTASEELLPLNVHAPVVSHKIESGAVEVKFRYADPDAPKQLDFANTDCELEGSSMKIGALLDVMIHAHLSAITHGDPRSKLGGTHAGRTSLGRTFRDEHMFVGAHEVAWIQINLDYSVEVIFPVINTKFGVSGRGGFIKLAYPPGTMGYKNLELEITTKPPLTAPNT